MPQTNWTLEEAHAHLGQVLDQALTQGPQHITREGQTTAVLVSAAEWELKTARPHNLAEFFAASPLRGSGLVVERLTDGPRPDTFSHSFPDNL